MNSRRLGAASAGLLVAQMITNLSMLLYNRVMSDKLGSDYAQLTVLTALVNVLGSVTLGLNTTLVKAFSADAELKGPGAVKGRLLLLLKPGLATLAVAAILLGAASPWLTAYFKLPNAWLVPMVDLVFVTGVLLLALKAAQQGLHHFGWFSLSVGGEGATRAGAVLAPVTIGVAGGLFAVLLGQVVAIACTLGGLLGLGKARRPVRNPLGGEGLSHALREGGVDTLALTLLALLSYVDVMVLKHYYPEDRAALYSRAALLAKSFLYLPGALNPILLAVAAREMAGGRDPRRLLERFLLGALGLDVLGLAVVWAFTPLCMSILAGPKPEFQTLPMMDLTRWFSLAVIPLGLLQMVITYLLAIRRGGVALSMGILALVYLGALHLSWAKELNVVAALGGCSLAGLLAMLWLALSKPPKPGALAPS